MRLASPRLLPLALAALFVLPAADAQRRTVVRQNDGPVGGTDLQLLADGTDVNGVGLRFWLSPQAALALRADVDYNRVDDDDTDDDESLLGFGLGLTLQNHAYRQSRVHPFVLGGITVNHLVSDGNGNGNLSATTFGVEGGIGAEARLMQGLTLSGQYAARLGYSTGDVPDRLSIGLGGVPRVALSLRF